MDTHAAAVIAAAGSGERLGAGGPKALVELGGRPLIAWSLEAMAAAGSVTLVAIAAPPGHEQDLERIAGGFAGRPDRPGGFHPIVVTGGTHERCRSASPLPRSLRRPRSSPFTTPPGRWSPPG